ncbi:hypothetical protein PAE9249_02735 [Paenibacillus sp. CECT 9249]|nr:LPXTG cell wall anchor domain-containing protein [Paenibacillus sp. CECT 9249]CAH0120219.1 hypothetical protein PAE9249_02735 [Paenibacillus sp. CECT 9249]
MGKKASVVIIGLLLILQSMFVGGVVQADESATPESLLLVEAGENETGTVTDAVYNPSPEESGSILTKVTLTDEQGNVVDTVLNPDSRLEIGSAVNLYYEWELPDPHGYKAGDKFTFQLPRQFEIFTDIDAPLTTADGGTVGNFTVDRSGQVVMTFNDYVENHSRVSGTLQIRTEFTKEVVNGNTEVTIVFPVKGGEQTVTVQIKPESGTALEKRGDLVESGDIQWTIDINKQLEAIKHAVVTDPTPDGLELIADSIKVYRLQVNGDGSTATGAELDPQAYAIEIDSSGAGFKLSFRDETINKAYRVQYATRVVGEETKFANTATLSGEDLKDVSATATVTVKRGELLAKKAAKYDPATQTIAWEIRYNFGNKKIDKEDAWLQDRFDGRLQWIDGSFKIYKGQTKEELDNDAYELNVLGKPDQDGKLGFDLQFNSDIDSAYTIVYETKVTDRVDENKTVKNLVTTEGGSKEAGQPLERVILNKFNTNEKYEHKTDYNAKTTTWTIRVNLDKYPMDNVVVKDVFPNGGLEFLPETLRIVTADGKAVSDNDYTVVSEDPRAGFEVHFNGIITDTYLIVYETKFNNEWKPDKTKAPFLNRAILTWTENGESKGPIESDAEFWPDTLTQHNGAKDGSYDAVEKKITWNIKVNYNKNTINPAKVIDRLAKGQTYVEGSLKVHEMTLLGWWNGVQKGKEVPADRYTATLPDSRNDNTLSVEFKDGIDSPYWITFETSLQGELVPAAVNNKAVLQSGNETVAEWDAKVPIPHGGEYVTKNGKQNGNKIDWTIRINEGQSHVSNAKIVDKPSDNQILIEDSFRLYATTVNEKGDIAKAEELIRDTDYTLKITREDNDEERFELVFLKDIDSAYILEYQSFINAPDKSKVSNTVSFEGEQITTETRETTEEIIVRTSSGSGSGGGVTGSLEVTKTDKADSSKRLAGAKFALYDAKGERTPIVRTTNEEGKILFSKLLYGEYILEELAAPDGYVIDDAKINITIVSSIAQDAFVKKITVTNSKKRTPVDPGNPSNPGNPGNPQEPGGSTTPPGTSTPADPDPVNPPAETEEIDDEETPLGGVDPEEPPADRPEDPLVEVDDENIPRGGVDETPKGDKPGPLLPKTGEDSHWPFYATGLALIVLGGFMGRKRTKQQ